MNYLQKLIEDKKREGFSLRRIAKESGVEYRSLYNYFKSGTEPRGKNLRLLAEYFKVEFYELLEDYTGEKISQTRREMIAYLLSAKEEEVEALRVLLHIGHKAD